MEEKDDILNTAAQLLVLDPPEDEESAELVDGLAQSELQGRILNAAEVYNLAQDLEDSLKSEIAEKCIKGFDADQESRVEWMKKHTFWMSLYMQSDYAENADPDRTWGATESVPILAEACDQFQSRTYKIFFPNDTFVSAVPMRRTTQNRKILEERADRIGKHMSYQLGFQDRSYRQDKDALFLGVAIHGSFFTKTYFDAKLKRWKVDNVRPTDLVVNYHVGPCRLEDKAVFRKTHIIYSTVGHTEQLVNEGYLLEPAKGGEGKIDDEYQLKVDEIQGTEKSESGLRADEQAFLIEQQCYLDLDGTGTLKPFIATLDLVGRKLLRLTIGYEADENGNPLDDYKEVQLYTHYKYAENPDGFYGLGLGQKIGDLNSAVNIMLRQSMDAATLANEGNMSGFISENLGVDGDEVKMSLGKFRKVPNSVGDFKNSIMTMQFAGPNQALMKLAEWLDLRAQRIGAITEATTGSNEKVVQPTTLMNQIEQALEQFSSVQTRLANSLSEELQKIYKINQKYLPLVDYFVVNGEPEAITREDYNDDMLIEPIFDPKYATQSQKVARAQAELQATLQNPCIVGPIEVKPEAIMAAFRRYLEALQVEDIDEICPPVSQAENLDNQLLENMYFIMPPGEGPVFDVFPEQDHATHLAQMMELEIYLQGMDPVQQQAVIKHKQKHEGYLYGQQRGLVPPPPPLSVPTPPASLRQDVQMGDPAFGPNLPMFEAPRNGEDMGGPA